MLFIVLFPPKSGTPKETCGWQFPTNTHNFYPMKQNAKKSGRPPKAEPTTFRCSVNFTATEEAKLLSMYEQTRVSSLSAFIKMQLFGKTFTVHHIDDSTRIFIDKLSSLNAHYRTISADYSNLIHLLRLNFTEKKAMSALYKLEQATIDLVKTNREIVSLSQLFDELWRNKSEVL